MDGTGTGTGTGEREGEVVGGEVWVGCGEAMVWGGEGGWLNGGWC